MTDPVNGKWRTLISRTIRAGATALVVTGLFLAVKHYMGDPLDPLAGLFFFGVCFVVLFAMGDRFRGRTW